MSFLPLALVTFAVAAPYFVVAALWMCAVHRLFWLAGYGQGTIHGLRGVCPFLAPQPNLGLTPSKTLFKINILQTNFAQQKNSISIMH